MGKNYPRIVMIRLDDWEALYVDGELKCQNHTIQLHDFCKHVGLEDFDSQWIHEGDGFEDWFDSVGWTLPDKLSEIPQDLLVN